MRTAIAEDGLEASKDQSASYSGARPPQEFTEFLKAVAMQMGATHGQLPQRSRSLEKNLTSKMSSVAKGNLCARLEGNLAAMQFLGRDAMPRPPVGLAEKINPSILECQKGFCKPVAVFSCSTVAQESSARRDPAKVRGSVPRVKK